MSWDGEGYLARPSGVEAFVREYKRLDKALEAALAEAYETAHRYAKAEHAYSLAWAQAYVAADGPQHLRKAEADIATEALREQVTLLERLHRTAIKAIDSRRAQISALQTVANVQKAEAEFTRTRP